MLKRYNPAIQSVLGRIAYDASSLCQRVSRTSPNAVSDEDDFTSRLAHSIEASLNGQTVNGLKFRVTTRRLRWRGSHAEEPRAGADLILVVSLHTPEAQFSKGYLIQAKIEDDTASAPLTSLPASEHRRLGSQCEKMLDVTGESYVWVDRPDGIAVLRAIAVAGSGPSVAAELQHRPFRSFWRDALECWNGDPLLTDASPRGLESAIERSQAKQLLEMAATSVEMER